MADIVWQPPPATIALSLAELHLWRVNLHRSPTELKILQRFLSSDEIDRAERFRQPHQQQRFIAGRGILRSLLGRYLACDPAQLDFQYGSHGKPYLAHTELQFNLAHSQDWGVYAMVRSQQIGVDLEQIRPIDALDRLLARFFTDQERTRILALPLEQQPAAFVKLWTAREAILKATGKGLAGISQTQMTDRTVWDGTAIVSGAEPGTEPTQWQYFYFIPWDGYWGAVAVQAGIDRQMAWDWDGKIFAGTIG